MPHKVEISDKTFEDLKEFCVLNDLKIGQYADKLIREGLMIEMYGDVPFADYKRKIMKEFPVEQFEKEYIQQPGPITEEMEKRYEDMDEAERMTRQRKKEKEEVEQFKRSIDEAIAKGEVKHVEAPPIPEEIIERKKVLDKELLENIGVPEKVVKRITKRRLK